MLRLLSEDRIPAPCGAIIYFTRPMAQELCLRAVIQLWTHYWPVMPRVLSIYKTVVLPSMRVPVPTPRANKDMDGQTRTGSFDIGADEVSAATVTAQILSPSMVGPNAGNPPNPACEPVSASADDGNVPANVLDNDLNTRWSASGDGQWVQFCLEIRPPSALCRSAFSTMEIFVLPLLMYWWAMMELRDQCCRWPYKQWGQHRAGNIQFYTGHRQIRSHCWSW